MACRSPCLSRLGRRDGTHRSHACESRLRDWQGWSGSGIEIRLGNEGPSAGANVTPFTVSRALAAWQREGVLIKGRGKILLQKPELLVPRWDLLFSSFASTPCSSIAEAPMKRKAGFWHQAVRFASAVALPLLALSASGTAQSNPADQYELDDSHFHLTNYIQEGTDIHDFLKMMGTKVGRVALFGIPLQQQWSYENSGDFAPTYYLQTDAPLYYYSFTDMCIAMAYRSLSKEEQARFDPMITGFNPTDMYAAGS